IPAHPAEHQTRHPIGDGHATGPTPPEERKSSLPTILPIVCLASPLLVALPVRGQSPARSAPTPGPVSGYGTVMPSAYTSTPSDYDYSAWLNADDRERTGLTSFCGAMLGPTWQVPGVRRLNEAGVNATARCGTPQAADSLAEPAFYCPVGHVVYLD